MHDAFVGRETELAFLRNLLGEARGGVPRLVLLSGTVGIGKTSLLRQFLAHAENYRVLHGSGEEMEVGLRYGVVEQLVADIPEPLPERLTILRTDGRTDADPVRVGTEVVDLLGKLQASGPVTVVVDDTQWADEASLEALGFALRRLRAHRVLVLLAARDDALERLPASLHRLVAGAAGVMMRLGGLEVPDLRALSLALGTGPLSRRAAARLHRHTGGNPLYARALLEELPPTVLQDNWQPLPAPQRFRTLVLARLAACPPAAERLVTAAAVLGTPCPLPLAAHLAEVEDPLAALEHAIANRMLEERRTAIDLLVSFPHPLVHATVYHEIGPSRRAALHANAAQLVEDEAAAIRHRVAAASGPDPDLAEELAVLASRQVSFGAWTAAADTLLAAARLTATRGERAQFVLNAVDHLLAGGCATEAANFGDELESFADSGRRDFALARLAMAEGRELEAERLLARAWRHRDPGIVDPVLSATIAEQLALHALVRAQGQQAVIWARRAMAAGPSDPAPSHLLDILMIGLVLAGRAPEALATTTSIAVPTPEQRGRLDGLTGGGVARLWTDDLFGARRDLVAARAAYHRQPHPLPWSLVALVFLAETEFRMGAWDDSIVHAELAVSIAQDADQHWLETLAHAVAAFPLAARGAHRPAATHVEAAAANLRAVGMELCAVWVATASAMVALAAGDDRKVVAALESIPRLPDRAAVEGPGWPPWLVLYVEALVAMGHLDEAEKLLAPFEALAATRQQRSSLVGAARARGALEVARGRSKAAAAAFRTGMELAAGLPLPLELGLLEAGYGGFLRRGGRRREAITYLEAARARFLRLDARPFLQRCDRELAACDRISARRRRGPRVTLTAQESAVARLVATGRSNREAAAELLLSVKTIEYHLGNVYAKVGVSSRTQLALRLQKDQDGSEA